MSEGINLGFPRPKSLSAHFLNSYSPSRVRVICYSPSMPQRLLILIVTVYCASLFPCSVCLDAQYEICQNTGSACGSMNITYPFGVGNRGCGLPGLQINCVHNSSPVIEIHGLHYTILKFSYDTNNFVIFRNESCQFSGAPINIGSDSAGTIFKLTSTANWTVNVFKCNKSVHDTMEGQIKECNASVYYSSSWDNPLAGFSLPGCNRQQVLVEVGKMEWVSNDTSRDESCTSSGGIRGYNISDSSVPFVCYCKDGPSTNKCPDHSPRNKSVIIIIGFSGGGVALTAIALVLFLRFYVKKGETPPGSSISKVEKFLKEYACEMPTRYSLSALKKMTNSYAEKLGEGGYGVVYKGKLSSNEVPVAVKILDRHRHSETQFMNEVATIGRVHHVNLVRLLGYCFESPTSALVYEYMVNGSLDKFLFAGEEGQQVLGWEQLYSIALGAARGIAYLHHDCEKRIIHFDIKPHNILLDADFTPKVSDFGLSILCGKGEDHISMTAARGTPGYVAPEVCDSALGRVTDKSDVYSFGMLLLEVVGGRKNIDPLVSRLSQFYYPEWAFKMLHSEEQGMTLGGARAEEIEAEDVEEARRLMTKVGLWCIQYKSTDRPCMSRVVQMLEGNGDNVSNPPFPLNYFVAASEMPLFSSTGETSSNPPFPLNDSLAASEIPLFSSTGGTSSMEIKL